MLENLAERAKANFIDRFGAAPEWLVAAPGRVNLIGEHTDYNEGFVFPAAIDRHVVVAASPSPDASKVWSEAYDEPAVFDALEETPMHGWARFPSGCAWTLAADSYRPSNISAVVVSDLPEGAGLSSSAAMELAFLTLWNSMDGLGVSARSLAVYGQACEHAYIGVKCGVMDQVASALGREGYAMLIDTRSLDVSYRALPDGLCVVVCDTGVPRTLAGSKYNDRLRECRAACEAMGVGSLRDADLDLVDGTLKKGGSVIYKRARHVVTENERCQRFAQALKANDEDAMGRLMTESHESLRCDYEVSCPELDAMVSAGGNTPGCVGIRMTGAGFGGACVALVRKDEARAFIEGARSGYLSRYPANSPVFLTCAPAAGARGI